MLAVVALLNLALAAAPIDDAIDDAIDALQLPAPRDLVQTRPVPTALPLIILDADTLRLNGDVLARWPEAKTRPDELNRALLSRLEQLRAGDVELTDVVIALDERAPEWFRPQLWTTLRASGLEPWFVARTPTGLVVERRKQITEGGLSREEIQRVFSKAMPSIKSCYERALNEHPALAGTLIVHLTIAKDGRPAEHRIVDDKATFKGTTVPDCVNGIIATMRFPQPKGGGQVFVTYPFVFSSSN